MTNSFQYSVIFLLAVSLTSCAFPKNENAGASQIMVLSTLHQLHEETDYYSYSDLSEIVVAFRPDFILLELTPGDLATQKSQNTKKEYPNAIYPLIQSKKYIAVAMEPSEPEFSEIIGIFQNANQEALELRPKEVAAFQSYNQALLSLLLESWKSAADVNSELTDNLYRAKHEIQDVVFGPGNAVAWERWNTHFLDQIEEASSRKYGGRILVLVGAEHGYWLRGKLSENHNIILLDSDRYLRDAR